MFAAVPVSKQGLAAWRGFGLYLSFYWKRHHEQANDTNTMGTSRVRIHLRENAHLR